MQGCQDEYNQTNKKKYSNKLIENNQHTPKHNSNNWQISKIMECNENKNITDKISNLVKLVVEENLHLNQSSIEKGFVR